MREELVPYIPGLGHGERVAVIGTVLEHLRAEVDVVVVRDPRGYEFRATRFNRHRLAAWLKNPTPAEPPPRDLNFGRPVNPALAVP